MRRLAFFFFLFFSFSAFGILNAKTKCQTRYPVVLAHGMGASAEILGIMGYWGKIPKALEKAGVELYITSLNGMDSTEAKALAFKNQIMEILAVSGAEKVNIIAHSHGVLYSRFAISNLGLENHVASLTSIAGPNQGSAMADLIIYGIPESLHPLVAGTLDFIYTWVFGDSDPDSLANGWDLTRDYMQNTFNPNTPDMSGVYYQSWAARIKWASPSLVLHIPWLIMLAKEGANDGLVSVESAKWGDFKGVKEGAWYSPGCDHLNIVGQFLGITPGFDAPAFYLEIAADLKARGF